MATTQTTNPATTTFVATIVTDYGSSGQMAEVGILKVGTKDECISACEAEIAERNEHLADWPLEGDPETGWEGADKDEDIAYRIEIHPAK